METMKRKVVMVTGGGSRNRSGLGQGVCQSKSYHTPQRPMVEELIQRNPHIEAELLCDIRAERLGRPEEIANAVLWLCSPQVGFVDGHAGGRHILYSLNYQNIKRWKQTKK